MPVSCDSVREEGCFGGFESSYFIVWVGSGRVVEKSGLDPTHSTRSRSRSRLPATNLKSTIDSGTE